METEQSLTNPLKYNFNCHFKERWIDGVRRSMTNHGLTEEDARDRDRWRNLVLGEGKPLQSGQALR
jgi:hypothetical protein